MFPIPATSRWSTSAYAELACLVGARAGCATIASSSSGSSSTSGPSRRVTSPVPSSSTGPFQSTPSCFAPRRTSHGRPTRFAPRGSSRQRPVMRRWLRSTAPPSKRSSRFFPTASTDSKPATVEALRDSLHRCARVRGLDVDALTDERLQPRRRPSQRIPFGHGSRVAFVECELAPRRGSLNIAALVADARVSADTLRKWEQRYGVLRPQRTAGGQRRYCRARRRARRVATRAGSPRGSGSARPRDSSAPARGGDAGDVTR